jgi:hypothetical protein
MDEEAFDGDMAPEESLTKRELVAAMALQGILSCNWFCQQFGNLSPEGRRNLAAKDAVGFADALLAELNPESK